MTQRPVARASPPTSIPFGPDRFAALWHRSTSSADGRAVYATLEARLEAPGRHFHTLEHIEDCVLHVDAVASLVAQPDAVELALWFHDVVLEPGACDNERRSAELFLELASGATAALRHRVVRLILATTHAATVAFDDRAYIVDIDLAGLADPWDEFMRKGELLRREAASQSDDAFYRAQVAFFRRLVARPRLYATDHFRRTYERAARDNAKRLLALRASQGYA